MRSQTLFKKIKGLLAHDIDSTTTRLKVKQWNVVFLSCDLKIIIVLKPLQTVLTNYTIWKEM